MNRARSMDLNCDMGEGFSHDEQIMAFVTSANIACGGHAGDATSMLRAVRLASARGVRIGAHPSLPDRDGFGRRELAVRPEELEVEIGRQIAALQRVAHSLGVRLSHVKPHGALYNMAARDPVIGTAVVHAVLRATEASPGGPIALYALAGSPLVGIARAAGIATAEEAFADRGYGNDGSLAPRGSPGALIADPREVAARAAHGPGRKRDFPFGLRCPRPRGQHLHPW